MQNLPKRAHIHYIIPCPFSVLDKTLYIYIYMYLFITVIILCILYGEGFTQSLPFIRFPVDPAPSLFGHRNSCPSQSVPKLKVVSFSYYIKNQKRSMPPHLIIMDKLILLGSDFFKMKCVCKTQMMPRPDQEIINKSKVL